MDKTTGAALFGRRSRGRAVGSTKKRILISLSSALGLCGLNRLRRWCSQSAPPNSRQPTWPLFFFFVARIKARRHGRRLFAPRPREPHGNKTSAGEMHPRRDTQPLTYQLIVARQQNKYLNQTPPLVCGSCGLTLNGCYSNDSALV